MARNFCMRHRLCDSNCSRSAAAVLRPTEARPRAQYARRWNLDRPSARASGYAMRSLARSPDQRTRHSVRCSLACTRKRAANDLGGLADVAGRDHVAGQLTLHGARVGALDLDRGRAGGERPASPRPGGGQNGGRSRLQFGNPGMSVRTFTTPQRLHIGLASGLLSLIWRVAARSGRACCRATVPITPKRSDSWEACVSPAAAVLTLPVK
jgi:hypothetical protein